MKASGYLELKLTKQNSLIVKKAIKWLAHNQMIVPSLKAIPSRDESANNDSEGSESYSNSLAIYIILSIIKKLL